MTHAEARKRHEKIRAYYREGHTQKETAEAFGTTKEYVRKLCRGIRPGNQYTNGLFDREANAKRYIEESGLFEYAGNFTGIDGFVDIRCKTCGHIQKKSMVTIRHKRNTACPVCAENAKIARKEKEKLERELEREHKKLDRFLKQDFTQIVFKTCPVCNGLFVGNTKYCSSVCAKRFNNTRGKDRRLRRISDKSVDKDIRLERLYNKYHGTCVICGGTCDWNDYEIKDDTFIAGNHYPSIDHIIPLSRGGKHSWDNVQLACRICNIKKGANYRSPCAYI